MSQRMQPPADGCYVCGRGGRDDTAYQRRHLDFRAGEWKCRRCWKEEDKPTKEKTP